MIPQALMQQYENRNDIAEVEFINRNYANWGTPEGNRIRPHYTLVYNYMAARKQIEKALYPLIVPEELSLITFDQLGIIQIDGWGNALEIVSSSPLKGNNL